jgi:hypothetical protein
MPKQFPYIGPGNGGIMQSDSAATASSLVERDSSGDMYGATLRGSAGVRSAGSLFVGVVNKTSSFTADTAGTLYTCSTSGGSVTATLPAAATNSGQLYAFKKTHASNSLIVDGNSSETVDGAATLTATADDACLVIVSDGTEWHSLSRQGTWS